MAAKCVCGHSISGYCQSDIKECRNLIRFSKPFNTNEAFDMSYVLNTYLDFASESKEDFIKLSIDEVRQILKILKQVKNNYHNEKQ